MSDIEHIPPEDIESSPHLQDNGLSLDTMPANVHTIEDFLYFLDLFRKDINAHPGKWENSDLDEYLEAMHAVVWTHARGGRLLDGRHLEASFWRALADLLYTTAIYE